MTIDTDKLKALALAATPQNFDSAKHKREGGWIECPTCGGDGAVSLGKDYCNYDDAALGVQFYGIGDEHVKAEAYYRAANPATVLELIAEVERLRARFEYIEGNSMTHGGGKGFTLSLFVPVDGEDIGCAIDAAIAAKDSLCGS